MRRFLLCLPVVLFSRNAFAQDGAPCSVDKAVGVSEDDARGVEELVCSEVRSSLPREGVYHVRVVRIGTKVALTLTSNIAPPKQLVLSSLDEVPVAAPRLVNATAENKIVAETQDVTNVVGMETRPYKRKSSLVQGWVGAVGATTFAKGDADTGAGIHGGVSVGNDRWSFVGDLRVTGGQLNTMVTTVGVRHHFGAGDVAPFLGMGLGYMSIDPKHTQDGEGLGFSAEVGVDVLRTTRCGGAISMRLDLPTFAGERSNYSSKGLETERTYTPMLVTALTLRF